MRRIFVEKKFSQGSLDIINKANEIIEDYSQQGYDLTLRQLYYQFVARDLIPNNMNSYKRLGSIVNDARLAGMIDWDAIQDRTRSLNKFSHWDDPKDIMSAAADQYSIDKWKDAEHHVEVWVEKDALIDVVQQATKQYEVSSFACRGYVSQSAMYEASRRLYNAARYEGKQCVIIHLGDHDPSGIDMTRDIQDRMDTFGVQVVVDRIALNMHQVEEHDPPPNPAKITDSRAAGYISIYGSSSWELDALEPSVIAWLIEQAIMKRFDSGLFNEWKKTEEEHKEKMRSYIQDFNI